MPSFPPGEYSGRSGLSAVGCGAAPDKLRDCFHAAFAVCALSLVDEKRNKFKTGKAASLIPQKEVHVRTWWRVGLNQTQLAVLERDAREMIESHGPNARAAVLKKAADLGRRHHRDAAWLSRVAACIEKLQRSGDLDIQPGVAPLQPSKSPQEIPNSQGETRDQTQVGS